MSALCNTLLRNKLMQSIRWNSFEAILYQLIFLSHNLFLFKTISPALLGIVGTTFSLIFLVISLSNLGFSQSISPFFSLYTRSKENFEKFFLSQLFFNSVITLILLLCLYCMQEYLPFIRHTYTMLGITRMHGIIMVVLIVLESIKKILRELLQTAFLSKQTAPLELLSLIAYVSLVWLWYFWHGKLDLISILFPMLITSFSTVIILSFYTYRYYVQLPTQKSDPLSFALLQRITISRMSIYFNKMSGVLFSHNCLVPFFALSLGIEQAGLLKFIGTISFCITFIIRHIFGTSGNALLAHLKDESIEIRRTYFLTIARWLTYSLYGIFIFLFINYQKILHFHGGHYSPEGIYAAYFLLALGIIENFFLSYETWYNNEEKPHYLLCFNLVSIGICYAILYAASSLSFLTVLVALLITRIVIFALIALFSFRLWRMRPTLKIQPTYIFSVVLASALVYFML